MTIKQYTLEEIKKLKGKSDLERLENMTEEELEEAAKSDPDSAWLSDEEIKNPATRRKLAFIVEL